MLLISEMFLLKYDWIDGLSCSKYWIIRYFGLINKNYKLILHFAVLLKKSKKTSN